MDQEEQPEECKKCASRTTPAFVLAVIALAMSFFLGGLMTGVLRCCDNRSTTNCSCCR